jgi:hypothetical protein
LIAHHRLLPLHLEIVADIETINEEELIRDHLHLPPSQERGAGEDGMRGIGTIGTGMRAGGASTIGTDTGKLKLRLFSRSHDRDRKYR